MAVRKHLLPAAVLLITCFTVLLAVAQSGNDGRPVSVKPPQSIWGALGIVINNTPGDTPQQNPRAVATSDGNLAVVWEDDRNGFTNIFAGKFDSGSGAALWNDVTVQTCDNASGLGNQNNPSLIDDGAGGIIVTWQAYCNGNADIYAQRIGANGAPLWGPAGAVICDTPASKFAPEIVSDGAGGAIIVWYDYRSGSGEDIYAQRVDQDGHALWQKNGVPVCAASGTQWYPKIGSDGAGGAIIVWSDGRASSSDNNIYGQRLNSAGKALWDKDGTAICSAPDNQERPVIAAAAQGAVVAWQDSRSGNVDIYAQKIGLDGKPLWAADGAAAALAPYSQEDPQVAVDANGGALVAWTDNREDDSAIYLQKFTADGKTEWGEAGRQLGGAGGKQDSPRLASLKNQGWLVVWKDSRRGQPLIYGQKVNDAGISLWQANGLPLAPGGKNQDKPVLALSSDGQPFAVWQDKRGGGTDLYGQKLLPDGTPGWAADGQVISNAPGLVIHQNVKLLDSGRGEIIMVFEDARYGYLNIFAQKISLQGGLLWGKNAIPLARVRGNQMNAQVVTDGAGGALVFWEDHRDPNYTRIYGQRINAQGKKTWLGGSHPVTELRSQQTAPAAISDGDGGAILVWVDERNPLSLKDVYAQRISSTGEQLWEINGLPIGADNGDQIEPAIISDGRGGGYIAWTDSRRGDRNPDIYAQRIGPVGRELWEKGGLLVCGAPDVQKNPCLALDREGQVLITWTDKGGGSNDIYAQRISIEGKPLWLTDGIPVCQSPRTQQNPVINNSVIAWEDYRYGNWDIYANALSSQGKLLWGDEGVPVSSGPLTQYAPRIIGWQGNNSIVAWEDYRSGKQYEIYLQALNEAGERQWGDNGFQVKSTDGARAPQLLALPKEKVFLVVWEDYTGGGKAIAGQLYSTD